MDVEDKTASYAIFRHTFTEASKMVDGKWYDSTAFFVQGSAWKIGVRTNTEDKLKYLGVYIRRCFNNESANLRNQEYIAEVEMRLLSQNPETDTFKREYQQKFNGGKKSNFGWPEFKQWNDLILPKNGYVKNDSFILEVFLAAGPPQRAVTDYKKVPLHTKSKHGSVDSGSDADDLSISQFEGSCLCGDTLEERAKSILDSGLGSDCEFLVRKNSDKMESFKASQLLLARASPVFEKIFFNSIQEHSFLEVSDVEPEAFRVMLQYVYNCKWQFRSKEQAVEVYYVAKKYFIHELKEQCVEYVWPTQVSDLWCALHLSTLFHEDMLKEATMKIVSQRTKELFTDPNFCKISHCSIVTIFEQYNLNIDSELEVFDAARKWAAAQCRMKRMSEDGKHLRAELGIAIKYIRFLTLSPQDFISYPMESGILSPEEAVILLRSINNKDKFLPCTHLCSLRKPRGKKESVLKLR